MRYTTIKSAWYTKSYINLMGIRTNEGHQVNFLEKSGAISLLKSQKRVSTAYRKSKPFISYEAVSKPLEIDDYGIPFNICYLNEPGKMSFGVKDFAPGRFIPLHHHHSWELIIIDNISEGPGFIFFDETWWRADPGSSVFIPSGYPNAWSAGKRGFRMLWVYGGCLEEAGRVLDKNFRAIHSITLKEERSAHAPSAWVKIDMLNWLNSERPFWTK